MQVVVNEAVLRRSVGGPEVMADQLNHLIDLADLPNVAIRVVPFGAGLHHGLMSGPFVVLHFPTNGDGKMSEPPTVYVEGFTGALYLDKPGEIERYETAFASIWHAAADEAQSRELFKQAVKELGP